MLGEHGMGLAEQENLQQRVTFQMGTLSKAAGLSGGYLAASAATGSTCSPTAPGRFIYSTAPPPALAHAAIASLALIRSAEGNALRAKLQENIARLAPQPTPIIPRVLGSNEAALAAARHLSKTGFLVPAIRYPTVPRGTARLRISLSAAHSPRAVEALASAIAAS